MIPPGESVKDDKKPMSSTDCHSQLFHPVRNLHLVCVCMCMFLYVDMYMYIHVCMFLCMYRYISTHIQKNLLCSSVMLFDIVQLTSSLTSKDCAL